ncbi:MAG: cyclic beta 1-2 glucan synthetase, partial [Candidatus Omnitrophica bacterium]|nr:cyclic beta 1-2 glucan synthetase [Candidatus Omnitrophota bacterium]
MLTKKFEELLASVRVLWSTLLTGERFVEEQPLRSELFSIEQFRSHARHIARQHQISYKRGRNKLLVRLRENKRVLAEIHDLLNETGKSKRRISPAGEWLLDNYYLIEEQIRLAQKFLPEGYIRELPHILRGPLSGYPRVYELAMDLVSHGDGRLDAKGLAEFVGAYQDVCPLKLGELWAVPIMLRLALIENLRRVSSRLIVSQTQRDKAGHWASRILEVSVGDADGVIRELAAMSRAVPVLTDHFVAEFTRRLHGQSQASSLPFAWLERKLSERGETLDGIIRLISQKQAADQVSIANTIGSLRLLEITDWHDFVEDLSEVEKILRRDPSGDYGRMSFQTRDRYRHVIEQIASRKRMSESEVALRAVEIAQAAKSSEASEPAASHVGYYLIDKGFGALCRKVHLRFFFRQTLQGKKTFWPLVLYFGSIGGVTLVLSAGVLWWIRGTQAPGPLATGYFGVLLLLTASQTAVSLTNWLASLLVRPRTLPRMDFSEGIPGYAHTLTVIPCM